MGRLRRLRRCNPLARHNLFWAGTFPRYFRVIPRFGAIWCDMLTAFIGNAFLYTEIYEIMFAFCAYTLGIRFCFLGEKGGSTKNPFYIVNYVKCIFSTFWFWAYPPSPSWVTGLSYACLSYSRALRLALLLMISILAFRFLLFPLLISAASR